MVGGHASGFYDWTGEAVMLEDLAAGASFEQLAGLDPLCWAVVGVELITGTAPEARSGLILYAVDLGGYQLTRPGDRHRVLTEIGRCDTVEVRRVVRPDLGIADVLAQMKLARVQFRSHGFDGVELTSAASDGADATGHQA